ncbi:hypothetical protein [Streptomyces sp. NPDC047130]|uniref:hypothetical protein n=1 Tax=Streptomyces sp. NPDC047130 TaxID=3155261 RepID=UPI0034047995
MFDDLRIGVLPPGPRYPVPTVRVWINGAEAIEEAVGPGGRGRPAVVLLPDGRPSPLRATEEPRRVVLGEPACTGGCCGWLSVVVWRCGGVVEWADWEAPALEQPPPAYHFDAGAYDAELARAERARRREVYPAEAGSAGSAAGSAGSTAVSETVPSSATDQPGL